MRNKAIEYPHPVLNEYTNDYINSSFGIEVLSHTDNGSDIVIELECLLNCDGLATIIAEGKAKPIVRVTCYRTSYRDTIDLYPSGSTIIKIEKRKVTGSIDIQAMIVKGILLFVKLYLQTHEGDILMTRIKTTKLVAILMAVFMAFAFMSFSLTYVSAEDPAPVNQSEENGGTPKSEEETPNAQEETPKAPLPEISFMKYTYGAPDVEVTIKFGNLEPEIDYESIAKNSNSQDSYIQQIRSKIISNIKVFKNYDENADEDKQFTNEINFGAQYNPNSLKYDSTNHIVTFTVPLNSSKTLSPGIEYYLWFGKDLNATKGADNGMVTFYRFTPNNTTTSSTSRTTTRTTYRTITTRNSTVRARSANTDDPSHLPVWIGLAAVSALMLGAVYFSKERD